MLCRSAALALARRHLASSATPATRIADLVNARAADSTETLALVVPSADIRWTYGELLDRARWFAAGLHEMGYAPGQKLGARLDNSEQLLVALVGTALVGADVETAKTAELLAEVTCRGTIVHHRDAAVAGAMIGQHEPIAVGGGAIKDPVVHYDILIEAFRGKNAPELTKEQSSYYFSTTRAAADAALVANGAAAASALEIATSDSTFVSVPLAHPMGFGFGVLSAFQGGARSCCHRCRAGRRRPPRAPPRPWRRRSARCSSRTRTCSRRFRPPRPTGWPLSAAASRR